MAGDASIPTTPPRPPSTDSAAPPPVRHSQRARTLSERARANVRMQEEEGNVIVVVADRGRDGVRRKGYKEIQPRTPDGDLHNGSRAGTGGRDEEAR